LVIGVLRIDTFLFTEQRVSIIRAVILTIHAERMQKF